MRKYKNFAAHRKLYLAVCPFGSDRFAIRYSLNAQRCVANGFANSQPGAKGRKKSVFWAKVRNRWRAMGMGLPLFAMQFICKHIMRASLVLINFFSAAPNWRFFFVCFSHFLLNFCIPLSIAVCLRWEFLNENLRVIFCVRIRCRFP